MDIYAPPQTVDNTDDCIFYHSVDFDDGTSIDGHWDLRGEVDNYTGFVDVSGKKVLDMGPASGFVSFELEKRGAEVVSADVLSTAQYTRVPYFDDISVSDPETHMERSNNFLRKMKNSYWYSWAKYGSKAKAFYGDLLNLPDELGLFEVGFVGQIMVHNRDPFGILQSVAERTTETLIISEGMLPRNEPIARFMPKPKEGIRPHGWFIFSPAAIIEFISLMGFELRAVTEKKYKCCIANNMTSITTIVADRVPNTMIGNNRPALPSC